MTLAHFVYIPGVFILGIVMGYVLGGYGWASLFLFVGGVYVLTAVFWACVNCTRRLLFVESENSPGTITPGN